VVALQLLDDGEMVHLNARREFFMNKRRPEGIVLHIGKNDKIVGIEILDASKRLNLETFSPLQYEASSVRHDHA
jgi:uncharacterized protein YuzE